MKPMQKKVEPIRQRVVEPIKPPEPVKIPDKVKVLKVSQYLVDPEVMNDVVIDKYVHSLRRIYNENKVIVAIPIVNDVLIVCEV